MNAAAQTTHLMPPVERQHLLLRALVGSLVLCAALAPPVAQSVVFAAQGPTAVQREAVVLRFHRALAQHLHDCNPAPAYQYSAARAQALTTPPHNMLASASGKRLSLQLEMSRAQAGNLRQQQYSIP